jgi:hypothetical protein
VADFSSSFSSGRAMYALYEANQLNLAKGDYSLLPDLHSLSSSLKSHSTITAAAAIEECRRACGGHGYSIASGLVDAYSNYLPQVVRQPFPPSFPPSTSSPASLPSSILFFLQKTRKLTFSLSSSTVFTHRPGKATRTCSLNKLAKTSSRSSAPFTPTRTLRCRRNHSPPTTSARSVLSFPPPLPPPALH